MPLDSDSRPRFQGGSPASAAIGRGDASAWHTSIFEVIEVGLCVVQVMFDGEVAVDYRFLEYNGAFERHTGLAGALGRTAREMVPDLDPFWFEAYGAVAATGRDAIFQQPAPAMGRIFEVHAKRIGAPRERLVTIIFTDVTDAVRSREALRESENRFRNLADTAPAMLWVTEADGHCSFLSQRWCDFTGQAEGEGLGFGWLDAVHPEDRAETAQLFQDANAGRGPFEAEHRLRTRGGEYRWVIDAGRPRFGADGGFLGYVGSVTDIHARVVAERSLRASRDRLDLVVQSSRIGLWYCDLPFGELDWNECEKEHFGLPADARVTLETFFERLHPEDRVRTRTAIDDAIAGRIAYDVEFRTVGLDGKVRWIRAIGRVSHAADGSPGSFDGISIDVTERVEHAEQLREADRHKDEFLAVLAHELRNPLAPIANGLQILEVAADKPELAARARAGMGRQLRHLVRLVDDLLDVSRISRGKLELRRERLRLADVLGHAVELARPALEGSRQHFELGPLDPEVVVEGDATRLAQAISNLLHNAAKFTPDGGHVALRMTARPDAVQVHVRDDGIGISPEMHARIFEMFTQVDSRTDRAQSGLGIGLALAHSLVALHGGSLRVESEGPGRGSEFIVTLPRAAGAVAAFAALPGKPAGEALRVLVVDDNREAADTLADILRMRGHEIAVAYDGLSALDQGARVRPDLVFLDLGMPRVDGFEVARQWRSRAWGGHALLAALTGWGQEEARSRARHAGFDLHVVKPITETQIAEVLATASRRERWPRDAPS